MPRWALFAAMLLQLECSEPPDPVRDENARLRAEIDLLLPRVEALEAHAASMEDRWMDLDNQLRFPRQPARYARAVRLPDLPSK